MTTTTAGLRTLGVGLIGANPDFGWGFRAHVPALARVPGFAITAVGTTREDSARRAAELTGAASWYLDPGELAADPAVDLAVVTVKVPFHVELVEAVLAAGKHVYCEWPLTRTTQEAEALTVAAERAGVQAFVGLQTRADAVVGQVRDLLTAGEIGTVTSLAARSSAMRGHDNTIDRERLYTIDASSRAGDVEVQGGHLLDLLDHLLSGLGGIAIEDGATAVTRAAYRLEGTSERIPATAPDVFRAGLRVGPDGIGTVLAWYGDPDPTTEVVVQGTRGKVTLRTERVEAGYARQSQMAPFVAEVVSDRGRRTLSGPDGRLPAEAQNVAETYRRVLADLRDGGTRAPRFTDGVRLHRLLDEVRG